jgi:uncharacterized protein
METRDFTGTLTVRETEHRDGVAAVFDGVAVPYGTPTIVGGFREQFAPAAFDVIDVIGKPLAWRHGEPIGRITHARNTPEGLEVTAEIADTVQGRDAATLARMGGMGLSVGFEPKASAWDKARTTVTRVTAALRELSLTHMPAYATAGVGEIRSEEIIVDESTAPAVAESTAPDQREYATADDVAQLRDKIATLALPRGAEPVHPLAEYRSLGEYAVAVWEGRVEARTIVDQITTDNPGVLPPVWMRDVKGIVNLGRPAISALGTESAGSAGMSVNWPFFDGDISALVGAQATEKTDITSVKVSLKKGSADLKTYAGGSDISYQLIMRSEPSYIDAYLRLMAAAYAVTTDKAFGADLVTAGTAQVYDVTTDTDGKKFRAAVFAASVAVETATGSPASVVLVASDVFLKVGGWDGFVPTTYGTQNVPGTATAASLDVSVSGLPVVHDRNLAAGTILVTNGAAASWIEDGPRVATAEVPTKLGRDVAVWGMGASASYVPTGIIKLLKTP